MSFVIGFVLLTNVFAQNPVCSSFNKNTWEESVSNLWYCTEEAPSYMIADPVSVTYRCCNKCEQCYKFEGAKCVVDESQWPSFEQVCTGSIEHCLKEKQQGNCGDRCICQQCEGDRVWEMKNGVYACYSPEELNPETPETPEIPSGDDICLQYSSEETCTECATGYTLNDDGKCIPNNCYSYWIVDLVKGECAKCEGGYTLQAGMCIAISNDNCTDYYFDGECAECKPGFDILDHVCVPKYCKTYVEKGSNSYCTSCHWNYNLVNGICILDTTTGDNVECSESITYKYNEIYHTHCTKCPDGYLIGPLRSYCRKAQTVQWEYDQFESSFMCQSHCKNNYFVNTENNANCKCIECDNYYTRANYLGNEICLPTHCIEPLIPKSSNVLDLDGLVHCGKCEKGYEPSMNMVTGSICLQSSTNTSKPNWAWDDGSNKEFILFIVMLLVLM